MNSSPVGTAAPMSTREAAALVGVGPSAVKRWADAGLLPCVRTAGGHRRFERAAVQRLARGLAGAPAGEVGAWIERLIGAGDDGRDVEARLLDERDARGSWYAVADFVGDVLTELGERWARGALSVLDEHLASERLARALARVVAGIPIGAAARTALLVGAAGDQHTLGLSLVELCLREAGWRTRWAGRDTPDRDVVDAIARGDLALVAVSASLAAHDRRALARQLGALGRACAAHDVRLVIGGRGAWPEPPAPATRFHDFASFHRTVAARGVR